MLRPGTLLGNRYVLGERVASGGMGEVWQATDPVLQRTVAVKVLLPALLTDAEFISRFRTEARLMAALRHPGIVQVHDYGADVLVDDVRRDFLVMEYVEGVSLGSRIAAAGTLDVAETLSVVAQAAEALDVAHRAGIVHRDVKPNNLLVRPDGTVVLVDFGVARSVDATGITNPNMLIGSPQYMAPEQVTGQPVTAATDIHALGAVAFCCLTGRSPFAADNPVQVIGRLLHGGPPSFPATVPDAVAQLVLRALAPEPARRFPDAAALAAAARELAAAFAADGPTVPRAPIPQSAPATAGAVPWNAAPAAASTTGPGRPGEPGDPVAAAPAALSAPERRHRMIAVAGAAALVLGVTTIVGAVVLNPGADQSVAGTTTVGHDTGAPASPRVDGSAATGTPTDGATPTGSPTGTPQPSASPSEKKPAATGSPTPGSTPAKNPYTAAAVCGSGYRVVDSASLKKSSGTVVGTVYLLFSKSSGRNCVVTLKRTSIGKKTSATAYLQVQGKTKVAETGKFAYYAGPIRAAAAAKCVKWGGSAGGVRYDSPYEHCG